MRIAFLGLGIMGRPMASRLVAAGHEVSVWNRTARQHVEGATTAISPADAAKDAEVVWKFGDVPPRYVAHCVSVIAPAVAI